MYTLTKNYRRANVWIDEAPPADFAASSVVKRIVTPKRASISLHRIAAVEIFQPMGPMIGYALLGGELIQSDVDGLEVVVLVNADGAQFKSPLVPNSDEAWVGLDDEYVDWVFSGVEKVNESDGLPTGASLRFRWAAHGWNGSSRMLFKRLSGLVVQLLMLPKNPSEAEIADLIDKSRQTSW